MIRHFYFCVVSETQGIPLHSIIAFLVSPQTVEPRLDTIDSSSCLSFSIYRRSYDTSHSGTWEADRWACRAMCNSSRRLFPDGKTKSDSGSLYVDPKGRGNRILHG